MVEKVNFSCEHCGKTLRAPEKYAGRRAKCPQCGESVLITSDKKSKDTEAPVGIGTEVEVAHLSAPDNDQDKMLGVKTRDDVAIVSFLTSRILDQSNVQQLGEEFKKLTDEDHLDKIVLDFDNIRYMSSAVMGKLVRLHKRVQETGGKLRLCNISSGIHEIFEIMRFDDLFDISENENRAVSELTEQDDRQQTQ